MVLLGIVGNKRSGKDTVSDYLVNNHNFCKLAFADPIKQISKIMFDFDESQLHGDKKEVIDTRWGITPRDVFQKIGTEFGQFDLIKYFPQLENKVGRNFWVKKLKLEYKKLPVNSNVIISDVRFNHEIKEIKKMGGKIIFIDRKYNKSVKKDNHISETELTSIDINLFDFVIHNNKSIHELYEIISNLVLNMVNN